MSSIGRSLHVVLIYKKELLALSKLILVTCNSRVNLQISHCREIIWAKYQGIGFNAVKTNDDEDGRGNL